MRGLVRRGSSALLLLAITLLGSLGLWVGVPMAWLWIASRVTTATDSIAAGLAAAFFGAPMTVLLLLPVLSWLSAAYQRQRVARGLPDTGHLALETVMVATAGVAVVGFCVWFFLLSGEPPFGGPTARP